MPAEEDGNILHEVDVEESVLAELEEAGEAGFTGTAIADAVVAHALNSTFSDTEVEAALNALGVKVNAILARLRSNGIIAT